MTTDPSGDADSLRPPAHEGSSRSPTPEAIPDSGESVPADTAKPPRQLAWWVLAALCVLPAFQTLVSVYLEFVPYVSYFLLKGAIVLAPVAVWWWLGRPRREVFADIGLKTPSVWRGLASGAVLSAPIVLGYYFWLAPYVDPVPVAAKCQRLGVESWFGFWAMATFISLWNSLVEEYYWRGFVQDQLAKRLTGRWRVILLAGGLFGLHHVFLLVGIMGWLLASLCTFGTVVAGWVWSWQRARGASLWDCYISHIVADLAGLWVGWDLVQRGIGGL